MNLRVLFLALLAFSFISSRSYSQGVIQQFSNLIAGDAIMSQGNNRAVDAGNATVPQTPGTRLTSLGVVNSGFGLCQWNPDPGNNTVFSTLCSGFNPTNGNGLLYFNSPAGAPLQWQVNGTTYTFPFVVPGAPTIGVLITSFGAKCDGTTDDSSAINAALSSGATAVYGPFGKVCRIASTITVPDGVNFSWADFNPNPNSPPRGQFSGLLCATLICIQAGNNDNGTPILRDLTIFRPGSPGSAPSGSVCIQWFGDANVVATNIWCQNNAIEYQIKSNGTAGAYFFGTNLFTCGTTDADVDIVQVPGVYLAGGTLGCNGAFDVNSNDVVRIEGDWDNAKGTVHLTQVQINKGQNAANCAFDFKNFTGSTDQFLDFQVIGGHVEAVDNFLCSDNSVASIEALNISNIFTVGGNGSNHFLALNAATSVAFTDIHDLTNFGWGDFTLAPNTQLSTLKIHDNDFQMPVHITGAGGTIWMSGNNYNGVLTVDGNWALGQVDGNYFSTTSFSDSALTHLDIRLPNVSCTLNLAIGGSSSGITYNGATFQHCDLANKKLNVQYFLPIESLGGLIGAATITGLPFRGNNVALVQAPALTSNLTASASPGVFVGPQATQHFLTIGSYTSDGNSTPLSNTSFANANGSCTTTCPILSGEISYTVGGN